VTRRVVDARDHTREPEDAGARSGPMIEAGNLTGLRSNRLIAFGGRMPRRVSKETSTGERIVNVSVLENFRNTIDVMVKLAQGLRSGIIEPTTVSFPPAACR
jgi:hypothetical protein